MRSLTRRDSVSFLAGVLLLSSNQLWQPLSFTFTVQIMQFVILSGSTILFSILSKDCKVTHIVLGAIILALSAYVHPAAVLYLLIMTGFPTIVRIIKTKGTLTRFKQTLLSVALLSIIALCFWVHNGIMTFGFLTNSESGLPSDWITPTLRETWSPFNSSSDLTPSGGFWNPLGWVDEAVRHSAFYFVAPIALGLSLSYYLLMGRNEQENGLRLFNDASYSLFAIYFFLLVVL